MAAWAGLLVAPLQLAYGGPPFPLKPKLEFDETSPYAMIIFEAGAQDVVADWNVEILAFNPESRQWTYGPLQGWTQFSPVKRTPAGRSFHAALAKPAGVYAVNNISAQGFWHACFDAGTQAFKLEAGKVNYIGRIDPENALQALTRLPAESRGGHHFYSFGEMKLSLTPPSVQTDWKEALGDFLSQRFPKVKAPVIAAEPLAVSFEPGHSRIAGKICQKY